jgi:hypothetical protein
VQLLQAETQLQQRAIIPSINLRQAAHLRFQLTSKFLFSISLSLAVLGVGQNMVVAVEQVAIEIALLVRQQAVVVH